MLGLAFVAGLLVLLAGLTLLAVVLILQGVDRANAWAGVVSAGVALAGGLVTLVAWWLRQRVAAGRPVTSDQLAQATEGWTVAGAIVLLTLVAAGFGGAYFLHSRNLVSIDNAQINGDKVQINAPRSGTLIDWRANQGATVHRDDVVGHIQLQDSSAQSPVLIRAPGNGTVAVDNSVVGSWVTAGTPLAVAYDLNKIYVTAQVNKSHISDVHLGAPVDITVKAYPHTPITGRVQEIQKASVFSLFPDPNRSETPKDPDLVLVKISLISTNGADLVPGMDATVDIHKT